MTVSVQYVECILAEQAHLKVVIVVLPHRTALKNDDGIDEWKELVVVIEKAQRERGSFLGAVVSIRW